MKDPGQAVIELLQIVGYNGNQEKTAAEFLRNCQLIALTGLMKTLTDDKREALKKEISEQTEPQKVSDIIAQYFGQEPYEQAVCSATANYFKAYFQTILPNLDDTQKENLKTYLAGLQTTG